MTQMTASQVASSIKLMINEKGKIVLLNSSQQRGLDLKMNDAAIVNVLISMTNKILWDDLCQAAGRGNRSQGFSVCHVYFDENTCGGTSSIKEYLKGIADNVRCASGCTKFLK